jgi:hypothetical protein
MGYSLGEAREERTTPGENFDLDYIEIENFVVEFGAKT